jgi:amicyanin
LDQQGVIALAHWRYQQSATGLTPPFHKRHMVRYARRTLMGICIVGALLTAASSFAAEPAAANQEISVSIENMMFNPSEVTVVPGTTVTWVNKDVMPHTVVDTNKSFRSKILAKGDKFSFTFTSAGDYSYLCSVHPNMKGKVIVKP